MVINVIKEVRRVYMEILFMGDVYLFFINIIFLKDDNICIFRYVWFSLERR